MNLDPVFEQAIQILDSTTSGIQETIRIRPWIGEDYTGKIQRGATRKVKAVVDRSKGEVRGSDGIIRRVTAVISILKPFGPIGAPGRMEPIDTRDEIFLVDDLTGPIISIKGPTNRPGTKVRYFQQVTLG